MILISSLCSLEDDEAWHGASSRHQALWFTKFLQESGWNWVAGDQEHLALHGHLLAGAPLDRWVKEILILILMLLKYFKTSFSRLEQISKDLGEGLVADVLEETTMNSLRVSFARIGAIIEKFEAD